MSLTALTLFPWVSMAGLPTAATPLTDAIAHVESSFGKRMRSSDGNANGWHQMTKGAWMEVNYRRKKANLPTHQYSECTDYATSSMYCYDYLQILAHQLGAPDGERELVLAAYRGGAGRVKTLKDPLKTYAKYIAAVKAHLPLPQ